MTTQSIELNDVTVLPVSDARTVSMWQQLYWLLRREVWEYRSIWIAPFVLGMVILLVFLRSLLDLPRTVASLSGPDAVQAHLRVQMPYGAAAMAMFAVAFLVGVFYCLEALQGERRDRSILFWKSMPISNGTTVLSKAMIPLAVLPLVAFSMAVILHVIMLMLSCAVLLFRSEDVRTLIAHVAPIQFNISVLYAAIVIALWHAPIYGWLLFLSSWPRRAALVWAILPLLALGTAELMIFGTTAVFESVKYMVLGWFVAAFTFTDDIGTRMFVEPTPSELLSTPSMWIGLVFAAACTVGAVYMRRFREPG